MLDRPERNVRLARLQETIRRADCVTCVLMSRASAEGCARNSITRNGQAAGRLGQLIAAEAWTDAALALIELELPQWKLRHLACEDGLWHCVLSKHPGFPAALDETAEGEHESLPLAILSAFVEAQGDADCSMVAARSVPQIRPMQGFALCCDNFA